MPDRPVTLFLAFGNGEYQQRITPPNRFAFWLPPGYYSVSVKSPRCWPATRYFVLTTGLSRFIDAYPGIKVRAPNKNIEPMVIIEETGKCGVLVHAPSSVTRATLKSDTWIFEQPFKRKNTIWFSITQALATMSYAYTLGIGYGAHYGFTLSIWNSTR